MWWRCGVVLNSTTMPLIFALNACLIVCEGASSMILLFLLVPSCSQLSSILLPSWFSVYLFHSLSEDQCVSKSMDPLKYFPRVCTFGIWQNALFLPFGVTYFNLVIWHRFSIKHPSIGLTMIKSLKRGLNKELFGYRWVDILDVNLSSLGRCSHPSNVFICREGRRNTEKHGKRFVTSVGANLTWCTSA